MEQTIDTGRVYQSDDTMLYGLMAALAPRFTVSPAFAPYTAPDNSPAAKAARVAAFKTSRA
jgi:hypothetical protein